MRKLLTMFSLLLLGTTLVWAQQRQITGKITDKNGQPVSGATIQIQGTNSGTAAGRDGSFTITAKTGDVLEITAVNFATTTVIVGSGSTVGSVALDTRENVMTEVVVTALGIQRQKKELGYSTTKVSAAELTKAKAVNVANGLQGKVSGLNITTINNGVFEEVKINLRGIRSLLGNNNPMLLLDGVPVPLGYLSSLNPNDIGDVNILKGSSAAAIYGPDARNGVIVVTTKRGVRGAPVITVSHSTQASSISFFPKFQTEFGSGGYGSFIPYENWSWGPEYDGTMKELGRPLEDGSQQMGVFSARPNERKKFFNTGITMQNDISFSAQDFYISIQDASIKGIVPDDKNRRTGIRLNTSREYGKFKVGLNVNYVQQNFDIFDDAAMGDYQTTQNVGLNGGLMNLIFNTPSHIPITSYKDFLTNPYATYNGYFNDYGFNPYFAIDNWRNKGKSDDLLTNLDLSLKATNWLTLTYRAGITMSANTSRRTSKGETPSAYAVTERSFASIPGAVTENASRSSRISSEVFANATKTFGDFKLNVIAGQYFRQSDARSYRVTAGNLVVPELFNVSNRTGELTGASVGSRIRLIGAYASAGIGYKSWAYVEFTGRNDWTSVLSKDNRSYFYPGVSASFVASDAIGFIKSSSVISFLKVRGSWNKTANADIAAYSLAATFSPPAGWPFGALPGYTADNAAYDPNLSPEFIESTEVGLEAGFLKNRINIEATYFHQDNTDQIIPISVSDATGYTSSQVNAASFINKGVELDLRLTPLFPFRKGSIDFKANATYNNSIVTKVYEGLDEIFAGGFNNFAANYVIKDNPAYVFKATDYLRDDEGHVIVDRNTGYPAQDPNNKKFGRTTPLWIIGLNPSITWNGLTLSALGEFRGGHYAYHGIGPDMAWTGVSLATARNHRERFVFPNSVYEDPARPGTYIPNTSVTVSNVNDFYTGIYRDVASNFLTSANSWRIREVSLSYDIPVKVFGKFNFVKGVSIALTGRNLFLWVPKSNEFSDPDFSFTNTSANNPGAGVSTINSGGVGVSTINPPVRTFGGSISVKF
jgi:TonB-linked SusC/RagA family outer membrane protein